MKIHILFTGGTIGSKIQTNGYINPGEEAPYTLIETYKAAHGNFMDFTSEEPYCILSENLTGKYELMLIRAVAKALEDKTIDGLIVTHGTDTLQYSAAILSYVFGDAQVPIVLVSSDYVLTDTRANGQNNFDTAVRFISEKRGHGVFVSYKNRNDFATIHRGNRLLPSTAYSADNCSVCGSWYGRYENGCWITGPNYVVKDGILAFPIEKDNLVLSEHAQGLMVIAPLLGMTYPTITNDVKAVLHLSYHSGAINVMDGLAEFCKEAAEKNIPVFLNGLDMNADAYDTVRQYLDMGIIPLPKGSPVAHYCKLWLAISNNLDVQKIMMQSIAEDYI